MPEAQSPAEVVSPLIWLRELKSIEFPLSIATETTEAAEMAAKFSLLYVMMERSIIAATEEAIEISIHVLRPAECLLLERSQPMSAASMTARKMRNRIE